MELIDRNEIISVKTTDEDENLVRIVVRMEYPYLSARLIIDGNQYDDITNIIEPFDRSTHVFVARKSVFNARKNLFFSCFEPDDGTELGCEIINEITIESREKLIAEYDNKIALFCTNEMMVADGVIYRKYDCMDAGRRPVMIFALFADTRKVKFSVGTPGDGSKAVDCRATVENEALAAIKNGKNVVAATNADFFDMFGNNAPSGLCVKDGEIIANADSERAFFGILNDGTPTITRLNEDSTVINRLEQAVSGREIVLRNGELSEFSPLEPFSFVRHPRTAVGITKDNNVILLVIDGRIPDYSNGASLVDVSLIMKKLGAQTALNLDGGGSSIMLRRNAFKLDVVNNPADLFRPTERLIREGYNSIQIIKTNI